MGGHAQRQRGERPECGKIRPFERMTIGGDDGKVLMAVGGSAAVAGQVLDDGENAAAGEARRDRCGDRGHLVRGIAISTVPYHPVGACDGHIGQGQAIHGDAGRGEVGGDKAGAEARGPQAEGRIAPIEPSIDCTGGIGSPSWRLSRCTRPPS